MSDWIVWLIIVGFYAPLHYLMPLMLLFITGNETDETRQRLMRRALIDSTISMVVAFVIVVFMVNNGLMFPAMAILFCSMLYPFIGIWRRRRDIVPGIGG